MNSANCYEDANRASAYATLEFANTYYLAFRDLPDILSVHVTGQRALDFGCGTGRSTRVLRKLGFDVTGVDISEDMLRIARTTDPSGDYRLVPGDNLNQFATGSFDLVLCAFPFDNVPGGLKAGLFSDLRRLLAPTGTIVNLVSSPALFSRSFVFLFSCCSRFLRRVLTRRARATSKSRKSRAGSTNCCGALRFSQACACPSP